MAKLEYIRAKHVGKIVIVPANMGRQVETFVVKRKKDRFLLRFGIEEGYEKWVGRGQRILEVLGDPEDVNQTYLKQDPEETSEGETNIHPMPKKK